MIRKLHCPDSYLKADPDEIKRIVNGCGPGGWKLDFIPDTIHGHDVTEACNIHDWRYHLGGTALDRFDADLELLTNLIILCCDSNGCVDTRDILRCNEYFFAVHKLGGRYFGKD